MDVSNALCSESARGFELSDVQEAHISKAKAPTKTVVSIAAFFRKRVLKM